LVEQAGYQWAITTAYGTNKLPRLAQDRFLLKKVAPRVYENLEDFKVRLYSFNLFF